MTIEVQGLTELVGKLRRRAVAARTDSEGSVAVGYTAAYARAVHENTQMKWRGLPRDHSVRASGENASDRIAYTGYSAVKAPGLFWGPNGQAKFLEQPFRTMRPVLSFIVATAIRNGKSLMQGLLLAGLRLQRESQLLVPVVTGNLRNSAFTRLES